MTLSEFIKDRKGKPVDFDGIYPNQCMDLMHQYVYDVLEIKDKAVLSAPSAYMVYENFRWDTLFKKIKNTPLAVPLPGDIIVWGRGVGEHGHIAIFVEGDVNRFISFDANYPLNSLPHLQEHGYTHVLGWLRPINAQSECQEKLAKETKEKDKYKKEARERRITDKKQKEEIRVLNKNLTDLNSLYEKLIEEDKIEDEQLKKLLKDFNILSEQYKIQSERVFELDQKNLDLIEEKRLVEEELSKFKNLTLSLPDIISLFIMWLLNKISPSREV